MGLQLTDLHAVDVIAALQQGAVATSGCSHRRTQAETDESASDDESDASKQFAEFPSVVLTDADSVLNEACHTD